MKKLLPVVFCGIAAISYSQLTLAGDDAKQGAGPTDNPNVTRDAQGREHVNKGKHTGQMKNKKDKDASAGSGSTSAPDAKAGGSVSSDAAVSSDSTSGARTPDTSAPSISGSAGTDTSGSVTTK
jgi:hypothetical protein